MARGRHTRRKVERGWLLAVVVVASLVLLGGGSAVATLRYDRASAAHILPGVRIADVAVGGMTRDQAIAAVTARADLSLERDLAVDAETSSYHVTPAALGTRADVIDAVDRAFALADRMSLLSRLYHRVADQPVRVDVSLGFAYDDAKVAAFVQRVSDDVARPAVDAAVRLVDGQLVMRHARTGAELRADVADARVRDALLRHLPSVTVPVRTVKPDVTDAGLGPTVVVDLSENELYLYEGFKVSRKYPVATARPGFTTPVGTWKVVNKVEDPSWTNPDPTGWGAGMPNYIPPGPSNPLGTRALYLSAPGIRIHGTPDASSIGTYASHGCIRMLMSDVEALYPRVPVGTTVIIKP